MTHFRGLTWDHPRGRHALERAAVSPGLIGGDTLTWDVQPLEGFESAPLPELAQEYDLIVLDHPHLGDALAADCLVAIDDLFDERRCDTWRRAAVGPSFASYRMGGRLWALPLDAATQVSARRVDRVPEAPSDWAAVRALAARGGVALSLAGPHAFLTLCSMAVSLGDRPGRGAGLFEPAGALAALDMLTEVAASVPSGSQTQNPIALLDRMRDVGDIHYIPYVYGYVTHSSSLLSFGAPPAHEGRIGSIIGGTGIGVTRRTPPSQALLEHLAWLLSPSVQAGFIPDNDGQPSVASAWENPRVDAAATRFYSATRDTMEQSFVRPRDVGYTAFQSWASARVRDVVLGHATAAATLTELEDRFAALRAASDALLADAPGLRPAREARS